MSCDLSPSAPPCYRNLSGVTMGGKRYSILAVPPAKFWQIEVVNDPPYMAYTDNQTLFAEYAVRGYCGLSQSIRDRLPNNCTEATPTRLLYHEPSPAVDYFRHLVAWILLIGILKVFFVIINRREKKKMRGPPEQVNENENVETNTVSCQASTGCKPDVRFDCWGNQVNRHGMSSEGTVCCVTCRVDHTSTFPIALEGDEVEAQGEVVDTATAAVTSDQATRGFTDGNEVEDAAGSEQTEGTGSDEEDSTEAEWVVL